MPLAVKWNGKSAIKFEEKAICKTEIFKKQAQKTSKIQLKQAQKQATRKSSKKTSNSTKTLARIHGKAARLETLKESLLMLNGSKMFAFPIQSNIFTA